MTAAVARSQPAAAGPAEARVHAYATIDGLRGVAALIVMFYHFGANVVFLHGYLAVDLFFVMSGFVIASAYEGRLQGGRLGLGGFLRIRVTRLAPLWVLGGALGLAAATLVPAPAADHTWGLFALGLLLIPRDGTLVGAFPMNTSLWSLNVELVVNALYGAFARHLTTRRLLAVAALSYAGLVAVSLRLGGVSFGTSNLDLACGYLRAGFGFSAGVVLFRQRARLPRARFGPAVLFVATALLLTGFGRPAVGRFGVAYDLAFIALAAPAMVALAAAAEPSARMRPAFLAMGSGSYALYTLHQPLLHAARRFAADHGGVTPYLEICAVLLPAIVLLAWLADRWFDAPVRRWLGRRAGAPRQPSLAAALPQ